MSDELDSEQRRLMAEYSMLGCNEMFALSCDS